MQLNIITPEKTLFSGEASMVVAPGSEGQFGVLPGHAPFITSLQPGIVSVEANGEKRKIAVMGGFAEVVPERCTLLAETARDITNLTDGELNGIKSELQVARDKREAAQRENDMQAHREADFTVVLNELILGEFNKLP